MKLKLDLSLIKKYTYQLPNPNWLISKVLVKNKKQQPEFKYDPIDPVEVFGLETSWRHKHYNLVGNNWKKNPDKPLAILYGFNEWKYGFMSEYLSDYRLAFSKIKINGIVAILKILTFYDQANKIFVWGYKEPLLIRVCAYLMNIKIVRVEDAFLRSSSLGAFHSTPYSLVFDTMGLYYNPSTTSEIELMLNTCSIPDNKLSIVNKQFELFKRTGLSKYNAPIINDSNIEIKIKKKILVVGQVGSDSSLKYGNVEKWSVDELIKLAWVENLGEKIVFRPHPEIYKKIRFSKFKYRKYLNFCEIEDPAKPLNISLQESDKVYTITSLVGLEAIFAGKEVTVVGAPFYAGWGLTRDLVKIPSRTRKLSELELFYCCYIKYSKYLSSDTSKFGFESAVFKILADKKQSESMLYTDLVDGSVENGILVAKSVYWPKLFFSENRPKIKCIHKQIIPHLDFFLVLGPNPTELAMKLFACLIIGVFKDSDSTVNLSNILQRYIKPDILAKYFNLVSNEIDLFDLCNIIHNLVSESDGEIEALKVLDSLKEQINKPECLNHASESTCIQSDSIDSEIEAKNKRNADLYKTVLAIVKNKLESKNHDTLIEDLEFLLLAKPASIALLNLVSEYCMSVGDFLASRIFCNISYISNPTIQSSKSLARELTVYDLKETTSNYDFDFKLKCALYLNENVDGVNHVLSTFERWGEDQYFINVLKCMVKFNGKRTVNEANAFLELGDYERARTILEFLIMSDVSNEVSLAYLKLLMAEVRLNEALNFVNRILNSNPVSESFHRLRVDICIRMGLFDKALIYYEQSIARNIYLPNALLISIYQGLGRIEEAYKQYLLFPLHKRLNFAFPNRVKGIGSELSPNAILLSAYGPGDEIRFATIYPDLISKYGSNLTVTCDSRLYPLFQNAYPDIKFISTRRSRAVSNKNPLSLYNKLPGVDLCTLMDNDLFDELIKAEQIATVPDFVHEFRKSKTDFPGCSFLKVDNNLVSKFKSNFDPNFLYVGLNWRSSLNTFSRSDSYLSVDDMGPLFELPGVIFVNLQYDECREEIDCINKKYPGKFINFSEINQYDDFKTVSELIMALDCVIAPCTAVIELAGALGKQAFLIANTHLLDWRRNSQNIDLWFSSIEHVYGHQIGNSKQLVDNLVLKLTSLSRPNH